MIILIIFVYCQIEDLFYNVPMRRKALKSSSEEYQKIIDIVSKSVVQLCKLVDFMYKYKWPMHAPLCDSLPCPTHSKISK